MGRLIAKQLTSFTDIRLGTHDIASSEIAVYRLNVFQGGVLGGQAVAQEGKEFVQIGAVADCHVIDLVGGFGIIRGGGQQIGLYGIVDVAEVAAGFACAVDIYRLALEHAGDPFGDDRCVGTCRVLATAEDVEVAEADGFEVVGAGEDVGVEFVDQFGDSVGGERFADFVFHLGQGRVVTIGGTAGSVDKALDLGIACGNQHV